MRSSTIRKPVNTTSKRGAEWSDLSLDEGKYASHVD